VRDSVIAIDRPAEHAGRYRPQAVVFDCDGVIADTVAAWNETFVEVAVRHGLALLPVQLARLRGSAIKPASQLLGRWLGESASPEILANELTEQLLFSLGAAQLAPLEGLSGLLAKLSGAVPMAVASNAPRRAVLRVLARLELTSYFSALVSADDVERPKPAAEPYRLACAALDVDPTRSVAVEDSEIGAQSADAAGMSVVKVGMVPWTTNGQVLRDPVLQVSTLSDPRLAPLLLGSFGGNEPTP
jgi:HAD superfamily hydrolase (TIGR01509 family)